MSKIPIDKYKLSNTDCLLLDTNILLYLFYPTMNQQKYMQEYARLWGDICSSKITVIISSIQISEFINRCIRSKFNIYNANHGNSLDYKTDYRSTQDYQNNMNDILNIVREEIIPSFNIVNDNFNSVTLDKVFIYGFSYDFNDALLIHIAESYNANIVTHDFDFANYDTKINFISANRKLLMFS